MKKSKLVTISSEEFETFSDTFTYRGQSATEKTDVTVSFPAHTANLMYYEHFDSLISLKSCRLAFIYVGEKQNGEISREFHEYSEVRVVDFSDKLPSVAAMFKILNQLPKCEEVRLHFQQNNVLSSDQDKAFLTQPGLLKQFENVNVKRVSILSSGDMASIGRNSQKTKFEDFLEYAFHCFPKLEALQIAMKPVCSEYCSLVNNFCSDKPNFPNHTVIVKDRKVTCYPDSAAIARVPPSTVSSSSSSQTATVGNEPQQVGSSTSEGIGRMQNNGHCSNRRRPIENQNEWSGQVSNSNESCSVSPEAAVSREEEHFVPSKKRRLELSGRSSYTGACSTASRSGNRFSCDYGNNASQFLVPPQKPGIEAVGGHQVPKLVPLMSLVIPCPTTPMRGKNQNYNVEAAGAEQHYPPLKPPPPPPAFPKPISGEASNMSVRHTAGTTTDADDLNQMRFTANRIKEFVELMETSCRPVNPVNERRRRTTPVRELIEGVDYERRPRQPERRSEEEEGSSNI